MESSKKVWQPPSRQKQPVVTALASQSKKSDSRTSAFSARQSAHAAVKPGSVVSSASQDAASKISVTPTSRSRNSERAKENSVSENGKMVNKNALETTAASTGKNLPSSVPQYAADASSQPAASDVNPCGNRRLSDVNEPTKQPVAARLAAWKKKTAAVENASTSVQRLPSRDKLHVISETGVTKKHTANSRAGQVGTDITSSAAVSVVERNGSDDRSKTSFSPLKDGEVRHRTLPRCKPTTKQEAVQPSWKKLGPATLEIQQKLTAMCENWKRNEIADKSRKERAEDLAVLENRWVNGLLADRPQETTVTSAAYLPSTVSEIASHSQVLFSVYVVHLLIAK